MGFLRIFSVTQSDLPCFISNNKLDSFKNKIFIKYKK